MTPAEAQWVRDNVENGPYWGHAARWGTCDTPPGPCVPCWDHVTSPTHECEHGRPLPEARLQVRRGSGPYSSISVPVWLADRICRVRCSCACRVTDPWAEPEAFGAAQPSLFAEV